MAKNKQIAHAPKRCRSLRAVEEFSCIGGDCENTCCQSWRVSLTKRDYVVWRNTAKKNPEELKLFKKYVPKDNSAYAVLKFNEKTGVCPFHDGDGLCRVHAKLGPEALPATCRTFPKSYNVDKTTMQANGSLGCPEYVRKVIKNDAATDVLDVGLPKPDTLVMNLSSIGDQWHWQRCLPEIGELGNSVVKSDNPKATLAERLFALAMMMAQFDDLGMHASKPLTLPLLSQRVAPFLDATYRSQIVDQFRELDVPQSQLPLQFVFSVFAYRLTIDWWDMAPLWDGIYVTYKDEIPPEMQFTPGKSFSVNVDSIESKYKQRRRALHARAGVQLQRWFSRAFCNQFYSGGASAEETPLGYFGRHLLTVLLFDFAICSHQDIDPVLQGQGPLNETEKTLLHTHVVNIMHRVGRTVLHVGHISNSLASVMQDQQVELLALVTAMLKELGAESEMPELKLNKIAALMR